MLALLALVPPVGAESAAQSARQRPVQPAESGDWTPPRSLPDSPDTLKWTRPKQIRMAEIHRSQPSFLRASLKPRPVLPPGLTSRDVGVRKASHEAIIPSKADKNQDLHQGTIQNAPGIAQAGGIAHAEDIAQAGDIAQADGVNALQQDLRDLLGDDNDNLELPEDLTVDGSDEDAELDLPDELPGNLSGDATDVEPERELFEQPDAPSEDPADTGQLPSIDDPEGAGPTLAPPDTPFPPPPTERAPIFPLDDLMGEEPLSDEDALMFNGRNCPSEERLFQAAWDEMRRRPISSISLDITPSINPMQPEESAEQVRERNLSRAPERVWRDRKGRVLAQGRMLNYRDGLIVVETDEGVKDISWFDLSNADLCFVSSWWELPTEFSAATNDYVPRNWTMTTFTWTASALCHKPLYFEEVQLERFGHSAGPVKQAALSGVHFFGNIFFLPYHMGLNPPNECQYVLGYYRPGSCAPWLLPAVPLSARGARWQLAAIVGGLTILP